MATQLSFYRSTVLFSGFPKARVIRERVTRELTYHHCLCLNFAFFPFREFGGVRFRKEEKGISHRFIFEEVKKKLRQKS